ncbi:hypothetical protein N4G70_07825 [Streptomyces sp. ASQP_92]|uniref:hypothetical protein n=1 Tax=Streptomyces sp. ASQP_92 TaxID=2979116 RepID=UPI0021C021EA|nr:hypothetical protein [Streptomyces sp. ASQP_92]MCT9088777.1 hypothetical protein [Streptomyces sp. ASQP_92]
MPDSTTLQSQYAAQIQSDLDSNVAEREQIAAQISALQEQLSVLENNHTLLASMRQAIGSPAATTSTRAKGNTKPPANAPKNTGKKTAEASAARVPQARKAAKSPARATKKQAQPAAKAKASSAPTLRDLVADHLARSGEPRSAAEITAALTEAHSERTIAGTVVRNTLENLVAKGQAQRTRQGRSVFYTAPDGAGTTAPSEEPAGSDAKDVKKGEEAATPVTAA